MGLISEEDKNYIRELFASKLINPVTIMVFGSEKLSCEYCKDTVELINEVVSLSDKLNTETYLIEKEKM